MLYFVCAQFYQGRSVRVDGRMAHVVAVHCSACRRTRVLHTATMMAPWHTATRHCKVVCSRVSTDLPLAGRHLVRDQSVCMHCKCRYSMYWHFIDAGCRCLHTLLPAVRLSACAPGCRCLYSPGVKLAPSHAACPDAQASRRWVTMGPAQGPVLQKPEACTA